MSQSSSHRESRFFTGDERELQKIKSQENLQKFIKHKKSRKRISRLGRAIIFAVLAVVFSIICLSVFFRVSTIEITGTERYAKDDILALVNIKEGYSLYEVSDKDLEPIIGRLPYIESAEIVRHPPGKLEIRISEVSPTYFCQLYGEYFVLSEELLVLERRFSGEGLSGSGLIEILIPEVDTAIVGKRLTFSEDISEKYVTAYLDALESGRMFEYTSAFDLRDRFSLYLIAKDIYLIELGNGDELATKLTTVAGMLEHQVFGDAVPATIDANDPSQCAVIKNSDLEVKFKD